VAGGEDRFVLGAQGVLRRVPRVYGVSRREHWGRAMATWKYGVRFASGGRTKDGVSFFPWDADTWGWVQFDNDAIRLEGKRRMGVAGEILTLGPWQTLVKNAVADSLKVAIPAADIECVTVGRNPHNKITHFGVRQCLDDGAPSSTPGSSPSIRSARESWRVSTHARGAAVRSRPS